MAPRVRTRLLLVSALLPTLYGVAHAAEAPSDADCLACHEDASLTRADGRPLDLGLARFPASVHGQAGVSCINCHADLAGAVDFPHPERLARVDCAPCHGDAVARYEAGIHAEARRAEAKSPAASCAGCHGLHDILPASDLASRTHHLSLARTCGACHGDPEVIRRGGIEGGNVAALFEDSIHGRAITRTGLVVAPNCGSCHRTHDIRPNEDPASPVAHGNVPATCGRCHQGILAVYRRSVHAAAVAAGRRAAVCSDCHTAHAIKAALPGFRLDVVRECGTCHEQSIRTYRDGFHGQASALGFTRVATCSDCHGAHDVLPKNDAASTVSQSRRVQTCSRCHPAASARFAAYDPHADPKDPRRSRPVYYTARLMDVLLASVFTFFGVHTALWFPRSLRERRRARRAAGLPKEEA